MLFPTLQACEHHQLPFPDVLEPPPNPDRGKPSDKPFNRDHFAKPIQPEDELQGSEEAFEDPHDVSEP